MLLWLFVVWVVRLALLSMAVAACGRLGYDLVAVGEGVAGTAAPWPVSQVDASDSSVGGHSSSTFAGAGGQPIDADGQAVGAGGQVVAAGGRPAVGGAAGTVAGSGTLGGSSGVADPDADAPADARSIPSPSSRRVFVSTVGLASGSLGGLAGGDAFCQSLADSRSLGGLWKAWLSDASNTPDNRFTHAAVPYRLTDGSIIANDWAELTNGTLQHAIDVDETGASIPAAVEVWTGTVRSGRAEGDSCSGWTSALSTVRGEAGVSAGLNFRWTGGSLRLCDTPMLHLYCFEQ